MTVGGDQSVLCTGVSCNYVLRAEGVREGGES